MYCIEVCVLILSDVPDMQWYEVRLHLHLFPLPGPSLLELSQTDLTKLGVVHKQHQMVLLQNLLSLQQYEKSQHLNFDPEGLLGLGICFKQFSANKWLPFILTALMHERISPAYSFL